MLRRRRLWERLGLGGQRAWVWGALEWRRGMLGVAGLCYVSGLGASAFKVMRRGIGFGRRLYFMWRRRRFISDRTTPFSLRHENPEQ